MDILTELRKTLDATGLHVHSAPPLRRATLARAVAEIEQLRRAVTELTALVEWHKEQAGDK